MTRSEWAAQVERMVGWWPHYDWQRATGLGSIDLFFHDLHDLDAAQVATAVEALYRTGREFPPNGAQIRGQVIDLQDDLPPFAEAWQRLLKAAGLFGRDGAEDAYRWLADLHPLVADLARLLPWREFCLTENLEVTHGQARRSWEQLVARHGRDGRLAGLPGAGLSVVERAGGDVVPIGDAVKRALPDPDGAA